MILALDNNYPEDIYDISIRENIILQGNLNPQTLVEGGEKLIRETKEVLERFKKNKHIFNLSHGVLPQTPTANIQKVVEIVRNYNDTIKAR
jgi:uroporphyrinogen decarboxylase